MKICVKRAFLSMGLAVVVIAVLAGPTWAYEGDGDGIIEAGEEEAAELARAVQNPVASLISLPLQNNTTFDFGPRDGRSANESCF